VFSCYARQSRFATILKGVGGTVLAAAKRKANGNCDEDVEKGIHASYPATYRSAAPSSNRAFCQSRRTVRSVMSSAAAISGSVMPPK